MKVYTFRNGQITIGWQSQDLGNGQAGLFLGEEGHGSRFVRVPLDKYHPAEVSADGVIYDAFLKNINYGKDGFQPFFTVCCPKPGYVEDGVLVRFVTKGSHQGSSFGGVIMVGEGRLRQLVFGFAQNNAVLNHGTWTDAIFVIKPGDFLKVSIGGTGQEFMVSLDNGVPVAVPVEETNNPDNIAKLSLDEAINLAAGVNGRNGGKKPRTIWRSNESSPRWEHHDRRESVAA